ncbi:hypothetical protein RFI_09077 [Reticulomyxa filosa]|uniref:Uncharacterized protein n=1 Tax=Reticulomyxa filosa TaxID=46433 RepID=X6NRU1_RETFI|nr:hypothetical protein RFI_09077 [Reticulomyxa filosa]|eukprot:ETO28057.1 hypothetical protein RFI_09077 [Reticulomyxa filosa]
MPADKSKKKKIDEFYEAWRKKVFTILEFWNKEACIYVPDDISKLVFEFCSWVFALFVSLLSKINITNKIKECDICWSRTVCGNNIQFMSESTVEFALDDTCLHTIATGALPIQKKDCKYFVYQLQFISPRKDGSWCIGIAEFPVTISSTNAIVTEENNKQLDKASISALKNTKVTAFDLNDGRFKANVRDNDKVQFLVEFYDSENSTDDASKGHGVVHAFHNGETYMGEFFTNIPKSFVPAVCTRASNQCVLEYLDPTKYAEMLQREREKIQKSTTNKPFF